MCGTRQYEHLKLLYILWAYRRQISCIVITFCHDECGIEWGTFFSMLAGIVQSSSIFVFLAQPTLGRSCGWQRQRNMYLSQICIVHGKIRYKPSHVKPSTYYIRSMVRETSNWILKNYDGTSNRISHSYIYTWASVNLVYCWRTF